MRDLLVERGIEVDLNHLGAAQYDIAIIHWIRPDRINKVLDHSPEVHIGVLNPGNLGLRHDLDDKEFFALEHVDFFIVTGFAWRDLLLPYKKRVYLTIDYDDPTNKEIKTHVLNNHLVVGYHGNPLHFREGFFPYGAEALKSIAREFDITLHIITRNANIQPGIEGVKTRPIEFNLDTFGDEIQKFDIGICPVFSNYAQMSEPLNYIRNPNRINTLLFYGIPSVTSPTPQSCHDLVQGETAMFAVTEEGWYQALRDLITQPELRNYIGRNGRKMVEAKFSAQAATTLFCTMLKNEIEQPVLRMKMPSAAKQQ
jgi:hypothetical protein